CRCSSSWPGAGSAPPRSSPRPEVCGTAPVRRRESNRSVQILPRDADRYLAERDILRPLTRTARVGGGPLGIVWRFRSSSARPRADTRLADVRPGGDTVMGSKMRIDAMGIDETGDELDVPEVATTAPVQRTQAEVTALVEEHLPLVN